VLAFARVQLASRLESLFSSLASRYAGLGCGGRPGRALQTCVATQAWLHGDADSVRLRLVVGNQLSVFFPAYVRPWMLFLFALYQ